MLHNILKIWVLETTVVEDSIEHHFNAAFVRFIHERFKRLVGAKLRIDFEVVDGVVFVRRRGFKNRCEIEARRTKIGDIV